MRPTRPTSWFTRFSKIAARRAGHATTFAFAVFIVLAWGVTGFVFDFSNTWQLVINTFTTIATFLMVFLIQSTQNRDAEAIQVKLDELIRSMRGAHNELLDLEELEEEELDRVRAEYQRLAEGARTRLRNGSNDIGQPDVRIHG